MKLIAKILVLLIASAGGLLLADYFVVGFSVTHDPESFIILTALFAVLQFFLRPILRLLFLPLILLTLGLFTLVINAVLLGILDFSTANLTIEGLQPLIFGTLIMAAAHFAATILWHPSKNS